MKKITDKSVENFKNFLQGEEKSDRSIEKYLRDIKTFRKWVGKKKIDKLLVLSYKKELCLKYAPASVNSMLSSINKFFSFMHWFEYKVKTVKIQKQHFAEKTKDLSKGEYVRLLEEAESVNEKLYLLMQTICATGIRVSELCFITVDAIKKGHALIDNKGKTRTVIIPTQLCKILESYIGKKKIYHGPVFVSKNGKPLDRSNIWKMMKKLCEGANVSQEKVFPHNLRHLFAKTYYSIEKDAVRLADILGHASINTTRIYTMETDDIHREKIQKLGLLKY